MAPKKTSDSNWEESEKIGPYQLHEPLPDSASARGELFRATNPTTGATALLLKLAPLEGAPPIPDWEVRCASSSVHNCVSMEVASSVWCFSREKQSAEELVSTFEGVRDGLRVMNQHLSSPDQPRIRRRPVLVLVGAAIACALVLVGTRWVRMSSSVEAGACMPVIPTQDLSTELLPPETGNMIREAADGGALIPTHPFPRQPYQGQKRPPCTPRVEVEIMGACWVPHKLKAPCPEELYEYQGECFMTAMLPPGLPRALGQ